MKQQHQRHIHGRRAGQLRRLQGSQAFKIFRIIAHVPHNSNPPKNPDIGMIQSWVDRNTQFGATAPPSERVIVEKVIWSSRFRTRHGIADKFFKKMGRLGNGGIFLIGDAGHVHSPAGGQSTRHGDGRPSSEVACRARRVPCSCLLVPN